MAKSNIEKIKKELEKGTIEDMIEAYNEIGTWLHEKITQEQKIIGDKLNELQAKKEAIKKD